ncbi:MAG TPA: Hsp20/alpha crystallin family protein [Chloroflexota bacterium]|jgi:HSP20 family protein|nr:Hsp20/alpha crystallin family protein [Chloroflexota bacterium]
MTMRRYDPSLGMLSLREAMYRLLEDSFVQSATQDAGAGEIGMPVDLCETRDALVARFALPGVAPEDIDVTITGGTLTVRGELREASLAQGSRYLLHEQRAGVLSRTITLPIAVQSDNVQAETEQGILTLTMPKLEEARARTIKINARRADPSVIESAVENGNSQ